MSKIAVIKLKNRLKSELQIIETINVLKQIAVSEYQFMERERRTVSQFTQVVESFFHFYAVKRLPDSRFFRNPSQTPAVVAVTSDEGFLGALNLQIVDAVVKRLKESPGAHLVVMGRQGVRRFNELGHSVNYELPGISLPMAYESVLPLKNHLMDRYLKGRIGSAEIVHAQCHSFSRQTIAVDKLLPFNELRVSGQETAESGNYTFVEPDIRQVIEYTIALWFGRKLYEIFWDAKLSEVAGRAIELNERYESLSGRSRKTRIRYFRAAHEMIDSGIREVFASQHFAKKLRAHKIMEIKRLGLELEEPGTR